MDKQVVMTDLAEKVRFIHEIEYGDFKRKVGLYLTRAQSHFSRSDLKTHGLFKELRQRVVYSPDGDIEATRHWVLEKLQENK